MNVLANIEAALAGWPRPRFEGTSIIVPTTCLYPSNGIVNVYVEGGDSEFLAHDGRAAIGELHAAIGMEPVPNSFIYGVAKRRGVAVAKDGALFVKKLDVKALAGAVALVANASREVAAHLIEHYRPPRRRPLSEQVEAILNARFPSQWRKEEGIIGRSAKRHHFDYVVQRDRQPVLIDLVRPDASSVNAAVVAHLDVEQGQPNAFVHRVIYDDREKWPAESLALLRVGAVPVALSAANDALARLAA